MYECKLCHHRATHPAFLRCQRCFTQRQELRGQSRSFTPSATPQDDYTPSYLAGLSFGSLANMNASAAAYSGGGGSFDGGGASSSYDIPSSSSSDSGSSSSSSYDSGSSSSFDSGSSGGGSTD